MPWILLSWIFCLLNLRALVINTKNSGFGYSFIYLNSRTLMFKKKANSVLKTACMKFLTGNSVGHVIPDASSGCWSQCGWAQSVWLCQQAGERIGCGSASLLGSLGCCSMLSMGVSRRQTRSTASSHEYWLERLQCEWSQTGVDRKS